MELAQSLGIDRAVILHVDDLGMCHGGNQAYLELAARGFVTCGSVMVPCPWFRQIAEAAAADPRLDLSVHLTLTSEWQHYRWAQIERALAAGISPTHIDAHMAAAMLPELLDAHLRLAFDYGVVPVLPRRIGFAPDPEAYDVAVAALDRAGLPVVDRSAALCRSPPTSSSPAGRRRSKVCRQG